MPPGEVTRSRNDPAGVAPSWRAQPHRLAPGAQSVSPWRVLGQLLSRRHRFARRPPAGPHRSARQNRLSDGGRSGLVDLAQFHRTPGRVANGCALQQSRHIPAPRQQVRARRRQPPCPFAANGTRSPDDQCAAKDLSYRNASLLTLNGRRDWPIDVTWYLLF